MDVLLSIPLISTLLTPSWSTSINLLFFYATWSTLVLTHDAVAIHACGLLAVRVMLWLIPSLIFLAFDTLLPSLATGIKFRGATSPPSHPARLIALAAVNMLVVTAVEAALSYAVYKTTGGALLQTSTSLPLPWQLFKQISILLIAREILTYYTHRSLLHGNKDAILTRLHNTWGHANPVSSLQVYGDHPLPLLALRLLPVLLPALAIRPHMLTYLLFTAICTGQATITHSGYSIVPGIILGGMARRTAAHYACKGKANYGVWGILDWAHGTSMGGDVLEDVVDEAAKHDVKGRSRRKARKGVGLIQDGFDSGMSGVGKRRKTRSSG